MYQNANFRTLPETGKRSNDVVSFSISEPSHRWWNQHFPGLFFRIWNNDQFKPRCFLLLSPTIQMKLHRSLETVPVAQDIEFSPHYSFYKDGKKVDEFYGSNVQLLRDRMWLHHPDVSPIENTSAKQWGHAFCWGFSRNSYILCYSAYPAHPSKQYIYVYMTWVRQTFWRIAQYSYVNTPLISTVLAQASLASQLEVKVNSKA